MRTLHPEQSGTPGKATAHAFNQHQLSGLNPAIAYRHVERERNRGGGGIAMLINGDDHFFHRQTKLFGGSLHDANIGLMRH